MRMEWEKPYIEALIKTLAPKGSVLQVGYNQGFAADCIQNHSIDHLTIIESDPELAKKALDWANNHPNVSIIEDSWQNALPKLKDFDSIFFNECPIERITDTIDSQDQENLTLKKGKEVVAKAEEALPDIKTIKYSDEDLNKFCRQMALVQPKHVAVFLSELKSQKQITDRQYDDILEKYNLKKELEEEKSLLKKHADESLVFLQECLKNHMHKNSRFSCFSVNPSSKYDNPEFVEHIITNDQLEYEERLIPVKAHQNCKYYKHNEALVLLVTKTV